MFEHVWCLVLQAGAAGPEADDDASTSEEEVRCSLCSVHRSRPELQQLWVQDEGELATRDEAKFLHLLGKLRAQQGSMLAAEQPSESSGSSSDEDAEEPRQEQQPAKRRRFLKDVLAQQVRAVQVGCLDERASLRLTQHLAQALEAQAMDVDEESDPEEPRQPTYTQEQQGLRNAFLQVRDCELQVPQYRAELH